MVALYRYIVYFLWAGIITSCSSNLAAAQTQPCLMEVNAGEIVVGTATIAITGATIIDGNGGKPVDSGCVLIQGNKIAAVGKVGEVSVPTDAVIVNATGLTLLPGFIDAHFHLDNQHGLPALFLRHGVTAVRDPGAWMEAYDGERQPGSAVPRLFLSGPHLDMPPPAYPHDACLVRDSIEVVHAVNRQIDEGASSVKVYFRMPPHLIRVACNTAHQRGVPVTAHLEITEAKEAIEAGLDGIEHITSFGLTLTPRRDAEKYRQAVWLDNNFRKDGRYRIWKDIHAVDPNTDSLSSYLVKKGTYVCPTLGPFEYRLENGHADTVKLMGFHTMKAVTAKFSQNGVRMVLGSHSMIPYAALGWAYQREMELWVESGIDPSDVIVAATMQNARYFKVDDRLGSIEVGKLADLVLIEGNPLQNISATRNIKRVMLNGAWINSNTR